MTGLILKRAPIGWNQNDYDVLEDGVIVGRIFKVHSAPEGSPWMWTLASGRHEDRTPTHGYEPTREAGMSFISLNVRFQGQPGAHLLAVSFSQFDPERNSLGVYKCCLKRLDPYSITLSTRSRNEVASERLD